LYKRPTRLGINLVKWQPQPGIDLPKPHLHPRIDWFKLDQLSRIEQPDVKPPPVAASVQPIPNHRLTFARPPTFNDCGSSNKTQRNSR
jgi:hypothetical protein